MRLLNWFKGLLLAGLLAGLAACGGGSGSSPNLVDLARSDARFSVLAEALTTAELDATLGSAGPYTLFAPTDAAFAALLAELNLSKAQLFADKALLRAVLQYHVLAGEVPRASVPLGKAVAPLGGGFFKVDGQGGTLVVTDGRNRKAGVTQTDLVATNGLLHVVDKVLLPADKNLVQTAQSLPQFSVLVEAVVAAGLQDALAAPGPLTVFAPTNDAFAALLAELGVSKAALLADKPLLTKVLTYHVLPGRVLKADVPVNAPVTTLQGGSFTVSPALAITDQRGRRASITATDVFASNGVIHVIDKVILPSP